MRPNNLRIEQALNRYNFFNIVNLWGVNIPQSVIIDSSRIHLQMNTQVPKESMIKVGNPHLGTFLIRTPTFECHVLTWGSNDEHKTIN